MRRVVLTVLALVASLALVPPPASARAGGPDPGAFTGYAFDARCAPTQEQMDAWLTTSPFWGVGIYIGGSMMSCTPRGTDPGQPHLDATWVARQRARGWRLLPIWVGPQASCHASYGDRIDPSPAGDYAAADAQGRSQAGAAVARARELGIPGGSTLWYDLEGGFDLADPDCRRSALRFLSGWTVAVRKAGFRSGVYSSASAGIHALDNADHLSPGSYVMPDQVWFAWYNGRADTAIDKSWVRRNSWLGQRVHQYAAQESATYGDVPLVIDRNFLEVGHGSRAPRAKRWCGGTRLDFGSYPTVRRGSTGPRTRALQCLLKRHGRYRGPLHGKVDKGVVRALRTFQRHHDLRESGRATRATWVVLLAKGSAPLLKVGSVGESVRRAQRALAAANGRRVPVTGVLSDRTARAVSRYQARTGLPVTGNMTSETWQSLRRGDS
jgi:peptidoglycan hydrolase-like protein with peptidoglycan-binding domain